MLHSDPQMLLKGATERSRKHYITKFSRGNMPPDSPSIAYVPLARVGAFGTQTATPLGQKLDLPLVYPPVGCVYSSSISDVWYASIIARKSFRIIYKT